MIEAMKHDSQHPNSAMAGRVSQLRHWFRMHWEQFQGGEALMDGAA